MRHYNSKKHKEMEDIQERVEELQRRDCRTPMEVPVLEEVDSLDANGSSRPLETEEDVEEQDGLASQTKA